MSGLSYEAWMLKQAAALGFRLSFAERNGVHQCQIFRGEGEHLVLAANSQNNKSDAQRDALDAMVKQFRLSPDAAPDSSGVQRLRECEGDRRRPNTKDAAFLARHGLTYRIGTVVKGTQPHRHKCDLVSVDNPDRVRFSFTAPIASEERESIEGAIAIARQELGSGAPMIQEDQPMPGSVDDRIGKLEAGLAGIAETNAQILAALNGRPVAVGEST